MKVFFITALLWAISYQLPAQIQSSVKPVPKGKKGAVSLLPLRDSLAQRAMTSSPATVLLLPIADQSVRASYPLETAYGKSTHIIFPSRIIYFDVGSDGVIADKPDQAQNILRMKANRMGFERTTMVVVTEDGKYYPFLVDYNEDPRLLNISIAGNVKQDEQYNERMGLLYSGTPENIVLADNAISSEDMSDLSQKVHSRKRFVRDVGVMKMRMSFLLTGVYVYQKTMFLQITFENRSDIDYDIDFFKFFLKDRDVTKRMAFQELEIPPYSQYPSSNKRVPHQGNLTLVFAMPMVTYGEDKVMEVQVYEEKGGRHLRFELDSDVIIRAKGL